MHSRMQTISQSLSICVEYDTPGYFWHSFKTYRFGIVNMNQTCMQNFDFKGTETGGVQNGGLFNTGPLILN